MIQNYDARNQEQPLLRLLSQLTTAGAGGEKSASFIAVVCWNQTAEFVAQYLKKGNLVGVDGRLQQRNYENNSGQKVNVVEVVADSVQGLEPKGAGDAK